MFWFLNNYITHEISNLSALYATALAKHRNSEFMLLDFDPLRIEKSQTAVKNGSTRRFPPFSPLLALGSDELAGPVLPGIGGVKVASVAL